MKTLLGIWLLISVAAHACSSSLAENYTIEAPGGRYGYEHWISDLGDTHVIKTGPWSFHVHGQDLVWGGVGLVSALGIAFVGWRVTGRPENAT